MQYLRDIGRAGQILANVGLPCCPGAYKNLELSRIRHGIAILWDFDYVAVDIESPAVNGTLFAILVFTFLLHAK